MSGLSSMIIVALSLVVSVYIDVAFAVKPFKNYKPCPLNIQGNNHCIRQALQNALRSFPKGSREVGVLPLDPLQVTEMVMNFDNSILQGKLVFTNLTLNGLSRSKITEFEKINDNGYSFRFTSETPLFAMTSPYHIVGKMIFLPIIGKGMSRHTFENFRAVHHVRGELYKRKGKQYFRCTDYNTELTSTKVVPYFENLFNGDKRMGKLLNYVMFQNGDIIFEAGQFHVADGLSLVYKETLNNFLRRIPVNQLFAMV